MSNGIRKLNDTDIEGIAGGMSCETALAVAKIYYSAGDILHSLGDEAGAHQLYGKGSGGMEGACNKG